MARPNPVLKWNEQKHSSCERKVLRKIYGPTREEEGWRIQYSYELLGLHNAPEIVTNIKLGSLSWLRHLTRANDTCPCKKVTFSKPEGTRRAGRPSPMCLDSAENDLRILGVRGAGQEPMEEAKPLTQGYSAITDEETQCCKFDHTTNIALHWTRKCLCFLIFP
jgi:hypothetical protein